MKYCNKCEINLFTKEIVELTPEDLIKKLCNELNIPVGRIIGNGRNKELVEVRHFIADILFHNYKLTKVQIGKLLGNRDHSTVINSIQKIQQWCFDLEYRNKYINMHKKVFGHSNFFRYDENFYKKNNLKNKKMLIYLKY